MKKTSFCLMVLLSITFVTGCTPLVHHADPFYDLTDNDFPLNHLPLINPIEAMRMNSSSPWTLGLGEPIWIDLPKSNSQEIQKVYGYSGIRELEKFAVTNDVITAYSSYVDKQVDKEADAYLYENYYHWFVMIPSRNIAVGFHTEDEFNQYVQRLGIQNLEWQTPDEAFDRFVETGGCLEWIPDCN